MSTVTIEEIINPLCTVISDYVDVPYCAGTVPLDENGSTLFYKSRDATSSSASFIDFYETTDVELEDLFAACQPATFGLDKQDVLDHSYRKAGKIDAINFSISFSPADLGIIKLVEDHLLQNREEGTSIHSELYKLNVYGPGGFFKSHVDTPRSDKMFGSLVIVLPTVHEGGSLVVRHSGKHWTFDTANTVKIGSDDSYPHASFISFFSDVEHEVLPVTSGYRVTLTYNLSTKVAEADETQGPAVLAISESKDIELAIKTELAKLLKEPSFLFPGGYIGFGLSYKYPFHHQTTRVSDIFDRLKGIDASIKRACSSLSLSIQLKAYYTENGNQSTGEGVLLPKFLPLKDYGLIDNGFISHLKEMNGGKVIWQYDSTMPDGVRYHDEFEDGDLPIIWIKPLAKTNSFSTPYIAHGNEATIEYAYCELCLIATIPHCESDARDT